MTGDLEEYRRQFEAIESEARRILDGLLDAQLAWQSGPTTWSVGDCLDHLCITGAHSLSYIAEAAELGRARGTFGPGPFRYRRVERWMVWLMEPPGGMKMRAPRAYRPTVRRTGTIVVAEFLRLQHELRQALQQANGLDLAKIRVRNPVSDWVTFSLGQEFAVTAAHERRHLWQVQQIKAHPAFPRVG